MVPRPGKRAASLLIGSLLLFGVGANAQAGWLYVLAAALVGTLAAGIILPVFALRKIEARRIAPPTSRVGDPIDVELKILNPTGAARGPLYGTDDFFTETLFIVERIGPRSAASLNYQVAANRRGVHDGGSVEVASGAPFGLAVSRRRIRIDGRITIHPRTEELASFPLLEAASTPNDVLHERPRRGSGMDFHGLREHRPGDSLRHVHWRSSARGGKLLVREYEELPASRLSILIDAASLVGEEPYTSFEDSVSVAATLMNYALDVGHPVQIFCDAKSGLARMIEPTKLEGLDWLAEIEAGGRRGLTRTATEVLGEIYRRSTVVLIAPTTRANEHVVREAASILQEQAARVIVVAVSARTYAASAALAMSEQQEESFVAALESTRAIVFKMEQGASVQGCLRLPSLV